VHFIFKFHCEINPIECVWRPAKRYMHMYTNFTLFGLRNIIEPGLDSVTIDTIRKYFRKARDYERGYCEGHTSGRMVEQAVKNFKSYC